MIEIHLLRAPVPKLSINVSIEARAVEAPASDMRVGKYRDEAEER